MAASAAELAEIRSYVGSAPDDDVLNEAWDRLLSVNAVALEVLRKRLADFQASPGSLSVAGDFSQSTDVNMRLLADQVADLEAAVASGSTTGIASARLRRVGPSR
jgi:hypothetical protein